MSKNHKPPSLFFKLPQVNTFHFPLFLSLSLIMQSGIFSGTLHLIIFSIISAVATAQGGGSGGSSPPRQLWCVAKNNAEDSALQSAIDWACGPGGADCGPIQNGGPCYDSSDLQRTASYAFNDYYHKHGGESDDSCSFSNTAALIDLNPSFNNCKFPSSSISASNGNLNGSGTEAVSSNSADLSSGSSRARNWAREVFTAHLLFGIIMLIL